MNLRKALLDAAKHFFVPVNFEVRMQTALHQHARSAKFHRLANLFVNGIEIKNVAFFGGWAFERTIEGAERAIFRAEVRVINVAVDDVSHGSFRMHFAANRVRLHADADEIIGPEHLESLLFG